MPTETRRRLTDQEVHDLLRQYKASKKPQIRDRIVNQFVSLVESVGRRFAGANEPAEDLVQEGYIGLITAIDGYDASKGVKFSTYATHFIIGQIKHHLRDRGKIIKEPAWLQELNQKITKVIESLTQELGRLPTNGEIAKLMDMTEEAIADTLSAREVFKVASLDGGDQEDESSAGYDIDRVKMDRAIEYEVPVEDRVVLETAFNRLKQLEQTVIVEFFYNAKNQTEIARSLGISCNYVSHILRNSTKKMRKILVSEELKESQTEIRNLRSRMNEQSRFLEENVILDGLTRLYNRRYFNSRLDEEISRASRYQHPVSVLLVKIDGHSQVSKAYGTIRGEDSLRRIADLIKNSVRRVDLVTRFDAETFGVVLPHTASQVSLVSDRIVAKLGAWFVAEKLEAGRAPLRVFVGWAHYPEEARDAQELAAKAIGRLEAAHDSGLAAAA